jgi:Trk-type K+ transport system membrane component
MRQKTLIIIICMLLCAFNFILHLEIIICFTKGLARSTLLCESFKKVIFIEKVYEYQNAFHTHRGLLLSSQCTFKLSFYVNTLGKNGIIFAEIHARKAF